MVFLLCRIRRFSSESACAVVAAAVAVFVGFAFPSSMYYIQSVLCYNLERCMWGLTHAAGGSSSSSSNGLQNAAARPRLHRRQALGDIVRQCGIGVTKQRETFVILRGGGDLGSERPEIWWSGPVRSCS